ncbi:MAG TPA: hypothetical protein VNN07_02770, partial [Candidatus Tectomicrobia bacterium]|nr:hypothetical protein [Candidatus Tectomicrobia bacterium]
VVHMPYSSGSGAALAPRRGFRKAGNTRPGIARVRSAHDELGRSPALAIDDRELAERVSECGGFAAVDPEDQDARLRRPLPVVADASARVEGDAATGDDALQLAPPRRVLRRQQPGARIERRDVGPCRDAVSVERGVQLGGTLTDTE